MAECWSLQERKKPDELVHTVQELLGVSGIILENKSSGTVPDHVLCIRCPVGKEATRNWP